MSIEYPGEMSYLILIIEYNWYTEQLLMMSEGNLSNTILTFSND